MKITDLKIICYVVTFSFWEPCSSIQYCCQIVNPNKINMIHSQSHLHTYCTLRMRWWTIWTLLDTFQRIDLVFNIYILVLWYDKHFAITANGFISDIFVWVVQEHVLWYKSQLCILRKDWISSGFTVFLRPHLDKHALYVYLNQAWGGKNLVILSVGVGS